MKTIEERYGCANCHFACCEGCDSFCLVKGATEQRDIDIEKAVEWLNKELSALAMEEINNDFLKNEFKVLRKTDIPQWIDSFRKAMKGA